MSLILRAKKLWTQISRLRIYFYGGQIQKYVRENKCLPEDTQK